MFLFSTLALPLLQTFACDGLSSLGMIVHLSHHTFLHNPTLSPSFFPSPLGNLSCKKGGTFPSDSQLSLVFSPAQCTSKVKTFLYHGYYNKHTQRALHHTNIITVVNFLTLVLCSLGNTLTWLSINAIKSFQQRQ